MSTFFDLRPSDIESLTERLFDLVYYGRFSYIEVENLPFLEFLFLYNKLLKTKNEEELAMKQARHSK